MADDLNIPLAGLLSTADLLHCAALTLMDIGYSQDEAIEMILQDLT